MKQIHDLLRSACYRLNLALHSSDFGPQRKSKQCALEVIMHVAAEGEVWFCGIWELMKEPGVAEINLKPWLGRTHAR